MSQWKVMGELLLNIEGRGLYIIDLNRKLLTLQSRQWYVVLYIYINTLTIVFYYFKFFKILLIFTPLFCGRCCNFFNVVFCFYLRKKFERYF